MTSPTTRGDSPTQATGASGSSQIASMRTVVAISVPFLYVAWKKTEGGWRWRYGRDDADERG